MKGIFLGDAFQIGRVYPTWIKERLFDIADVEDKVYTKETLSENMDAECIFSTWGMPHFTAEEIARYFPRLRAVYYAAGTVQGFAREFLESGVRIYSAWGANAVPVAEYTVAQIILANKGFFRSSALASRGERARAVDVYQRYNGNYGCSVGIIGVGMIGSMVCERLADYNLSVKFFDPFLSDARADELGIERASLEEIFSTCMVVSNHLANKPETVKMLKKEHFEKMSPYSTFINTGRGAQVDEEGLCRVLRAREDITAILDVTYPEPPTEDSPFYSLDNCILTPHIAGSFGREVERMAEYMLDSFENPEKNEVTLDMLSRMA
ncbi:MAG: hydroxyacid dehydrogenase [Clostridia bacterium]|nr:hydroxyacid dehydrogenase [Clostridia bacterium]